MPSGLIFVGSETQVNTFTSGDQFAPEVTGLTGGRYVVTWVSENHDGSGLGVYGQVFNASGAMIGSEFPVNTETANNQTNVSIAALSTGGFVVTWQSFDQTTGGVLDEDYGIFAQRFTSSGSPVGGEIHINTETTDGQTNPSVTALDGGAFVITWDSENQDSATTEGVYGRMYNADGTAFGDEFQIHTETLADQNDVSVTSVAGGGFVATWASQIGDGSNYGIFGQMFDASGVAVGSEFQVNTYTPNIQFRPTVIAQPGGGFFVAWQSNGVDGSLYGISGRAYDASGDPIDGEVLINQEALNNQQNVSVAVLEDGTLIAVWESTGQDGSSTGIYGRRLDYSGDAIGDEFLINTTVANQQAAPSVTVLANGRVVVTWHSNLQDGSEYGVYSQRLDLTGTEIYGGAAEDTLDGTGIDDFIEGRGGADVINGKGGADALYGGSGDDTINGGNAGDLIYGDAGADLLYGDGGNDEIYAGSGNDVTYGGNGNDTIENGAGADESYGNAGNDEIFGNAGDDKLNGGSDDDLLYGGADNDTLNGGGQNDTLYGGDGADELAGGGGVDSLYGGAGADQVFGGADDDSIYAGNGNDVTHGGTGNDYIESGAGADKSYGDDGDDEIYGDGGHDIIYGGSENDLLYGGANNDQIYGGSQDDTLYGGTGVDTLNGGGQNDDLFGGSGNDTLKGGGGADLLVGGNNDDSLFGGNGADELYGGAGKDTLKGGGGADILHGSTGKDILYGNGGNDVFVFDDINDSLDTSKADEIKDFVSDQDLVDLSGLVSGLSYIGSSSFGGVGDAEVRATFNGTSGRATVRIDVDGDGTADMRITMDNVSSLSEDDFLF